MKSNVSTESAPPVRDVTLISFDHSADEKIGDVDVDGALWAAVEAIAKRDHKTPEAFILEAIGDKVARDGATNRKLPKLSKGWVAVNLSGDDERLLRQIGEICGIPFRQLCQYAFRKIQGEYADMLGVEAWKIPLMSREQRDRLRNRAGVHFALTRRFTYAPEKN